MNYLKEITGKKDTSEFDVVSFPLVQKKKYFGTLEKKRQMCRLFISRGGAFWGAHWWCIFRCPVTGRCDEKVSFVFIYGSDLLPHDGLRGAENVG